MGWAGVNCKDVCNNCAIYQINTPGTTQAMLAWDGREGVRGLFSVAHSCEEPYRSRKKRRKRKGEREGKQCNAMLEMEMKMEKFIYMRFDGNTMVGDNNQIKIMD